MSKVLKYILIGLIAFFSFIILFDGYLSLCYPIKYEKTVLYWADKNDIDPVLVFSIINVESAFNVNAQSSAGAVGLMQLKLETANDMAEKLKDNILNTNDALTDYELNIKYGCAYLRYLIDYYNNTEVALCAYNAGLGNVNSWLCNKKYSSDGKTIDNIPFLETKNYISKIKKNKKIYTYYFKTNKILIK